MPVETLVTLERVLEFMADRLEAGQLLLITDSESAIRELSAAGGVATVVATPDPKLAQWAKSRAQHVLVIHPQNASGLHALDEVRNLLLGAYIEGMLGDGNNVLCCLIMEGAPELLMQFNASKDAEFAGLKAGLEGLVPGAVFETVMRLGLQLAREGREGRALGTLFVLGDTEAVLANSRQVVINPFQGHAREQRNVLNRAFWETVKEFAQLDGAIIVGADGVLEAAGRYISVDPDIPALPGLGGRHLAAASISRLTRAIAVVVSSSGTVRVFQNGKVLVEIERA